MLKDPPILTIRRELKRPSRELIAELAGAQTGHIVDALQGRGALEHHVKPVDPERASFVGAALTCECGANDNLAIMAALVIAQPDTSSSRPATASRPQPAWATTSR